MKTRKSVLLYLVFCLFCAFGLKAQQAKSIQDLRIKANHSEGKAKFDLLLELNEALELRLDSQALAVAKEAYALAQSLHDPNLEILAKCREAASLAALGRAEAAKELLEALDPDKQLDLSQETKMVLLGTKGTVEHELGEYGLAEYHLNKAVALASALRKPEDEAEYIKLLAYNYRYKGEIDQATSKCYESLRLLEEIGDSNGIVAIKMELGVLQFLEGEASAALDYFAKAGSYYERHQDSLHMGLAYSMVGLALFELDRFDESESYCLRSLDIRDKAGDIKGKGESLNNLALSYMGRGRWQDAEQTLLLALENMTKGGDQREIPVILGNLGDTRRYQSDNEGALKYYQDAIAGADKLKAKLSKAKIYLKIVRLYKKQDDYRNAFNYLNAYTQLQDSIYSEEKFKAISQLKIEYDTEAKERQIVMLQDAREFDQRRLVFTAVAMGMALAVLGLFLALQFTRRKKDSLLHEKEKEILKGREQLTEAELRNAQNELDYHKKMLATYTEHLLRKNALLEHLEDQISNIKEKAEAQGEENLDQVNNLLSMKILTDDDWEEFKSHFEHVHAGLLAKLKQGYPQLTVGETRLFILLKLQLDSKAISNILGVSLEAVKKSRHRLRKKLELDEDVKLEEFIESV